MLEEKRAAIKQNICHCLKKQSNKNMEVFISTFNFSHFFHYSNYVEVIVSPTLLTVASISDLVNKNNLSSLSRRSSLTHTHTHSSERQIITLSFSLLCNTVRRLLSALYLDLSSLSLLHSFLCPYVLLSLLHIHIPLWCRCVGSVQLADRHPLPQ